MHIKHGTSRNGTSLLEIVDKQEIAKVDLKCAVLLIVLHACVSDPYLKPQLAPHVHPCPRILAARILRYLHAV